MSEQIKRLADAVGWVWLLVILVAAAELLLVVFGAVDISPAVTWLGGSE